MKTFKPKDQALVLSVRLEFCFKSIKAWMSSYFLQMNDTKTQIIVCGPSTVLQEITLNGVILEGGTAIRFINTVKNLGIHMDSALTMNSHVMNLKKKCFHTLRNLAKIRFLLTKSQLKTIVNSLVVSCLDYCNCLFYGISSQLIHQLQLIQNACAKAITGKYKHDHLEDDLKNLHWLPIKRRIIFKIALLSYKAVNGLSPMYLQDFFQYAHHGHDPKLIVPFTPLKGYQDRSFSVVGPRVFNALPDTLKQSESVDSFKSSLKTFLFALSDDEIRNLLNLNKNF